MKDNQPKGEIILFQSNAAPNFKSNPSQQLSYKIPLQKTFPIKNAHAIELFFIDLITPCLSVLTVFQISELF